MKSIIGVIGDVDFGGDALKREKAESLGKALVSNGFRIAHGGLGDIARIVSEGARSSPRYVDGDLIAILPGFDPADAAGTADIVLATGLDMARNMIIANSDAVVALGGGAGTLSEIAFAWALKRPVLAFEVAGWSGTLAGKRVDHRRRCELPEDMVIAINDAEEAITTLREVMAAYPKRHRGIPGGKVDL
ncbi:MAG TPA: acyl-CoA synthetase [Chloroflexota bacterium]|nr:acyl-CoA synthetase [Chloroflexota bacterium]